LPRGVLRPSPAGTILSRREGQEQCGVNAPSRISEPARKILLATDLSARCDRALYRAAMLAKQWRSGLIVLHVVEHLDLNIPEAAGLPSWRRPLDPLEIARKNLLADIDALPDRSTVRIAEGKPAEAILRSADGENCDRRRCGPDRGLVRRRGAHRPEEQDHAAVGPAGHAALRHPTISARPRPTSSAPSARARVRELPWSCRPATPKP
jgi:hypothetical protein